MIYLIRHGESEFNAGVSTSRDCSVTELGFLQSARLSLNVDVVLCSSMKRAQQTFAGSKVSCKKVIYDDICREMVDGSPGNFKDSESAIESPEQFEQRMKTLKGYLSYLQLTYGSVAVFTHYGVIKFLTGINSNNCGVVFMGS